MTSVAEGPRGADAEDVYCDADCVILAEFHERLGPEANWAVPEFNNGHGRGLSKAELQPLAYSVMSVDYLSSLDAVKSFRENVVVLMEQPTENSGNVSVHFMLLDVRARGYVRHFALVYNSRDVGRLIDDSSRVAASLVYAVNLIKRSNRIAVLMLARRLLEALSKQRETGQTVEEEKVVQGETSFRGPYVIDAHLKGLTDIENGLRDLPDTDFPIDGIPEEFYQGLDELLEELTESFSRFSGLEPAKLAQSVFGMETPTIEQLCGNCTIAQVKKYLANLVDLISRPQALSVISEWESPMYDLVHHSLLTMGDAISLNFALSVNHSAPVRTSIIQKSASPASVAPTVSQLSVPSTFIRTSSSPCLLEPTVETQHSARTGFKHDDDDDTAVQRNISQALFSPRLKTQNLAVPSPMDIAASSPSSPWVQRLCGILDSPEQPALGQEPPNENCQNSRHPSELQSPIKHEESSFSEGDPEVEHEEEYEKLCSPTKLPEEQTGHVDDTPVDLPYHRACNLWLLKSATIQKCDAAEAKPAPVAPAASPHPEHSTAPTDPEAALLLQQQRRRDNELSLRMFLIQNSFSQHLIYSLLRGRPVVVYGPNANCVQAVVKLLSIFVLGDMKEAVCELHERPLRLVDLSTLRLVGVIPQRGVVLPRTLIQFVTVLKVDEKCNPLSLLAPAYPITSESGIINKLLARQLVWLDDASFASHVHESLFSLSTIAFAYYHMCCAGIARFSQFHTANFFKFPEDSEDGKLQVHPNRPSVDTPSKKSKKILKRQKDQPQPSQSPIRKPDPRPMINLDLSPTAPVDPVSPLLPSASVPLEPHTMHEFLQQAIESVDAVAEPSYSSRPIKASVRDLSINEFFSRFHIDVGDREIIQYLAESVKIQQWLAEGSGSYVRPLKLDVRACHEFTERSSLMSNK